VPIYPLNPMFSQILMALLLMGSGYLIITLYARVESLSQRLQRYDSLISQEDFEEELQENISHSQQEYFLLSSKVDQVKQDLIHLKKELDFQNTGFYWAKDIGISSQEYADELDEIREQQKQMRSSDLIIFGPSWSVIEQRKGERLLKDLKKIIISLFEEKCRRSVSKAKSGEFDVAWRETQSYFRSFKKISSLIGYSLNEDYLELKEQELHIKYKYEVKMQEEKEIRQQSQYEERERLKQERDRVKAEEALKKDEEQERIYQQQLDAINMKLELDFRNKLLLAEEEKANAIEEANILKRKIDKIQEEIQQDKVRIGQLKRGYIFVLSNVGFFKEGIFRICATTGEKEDERVRDMNRCVPFPFSVHFKLFSEDVDKTLKLLHMSFDSRRVNILNPRRDFFWASFEEIADAIEAVHRETGMIKNLIIEDKRPLSPEYDKSIQ
jgi:hypothetical protein